MFLRRIPIPVLSGLGVVVIIALIGLVTFFASDVIGETVLDQFRAQQLQLTTSVAQQTEAYFNNLNVEILSLAQQEAIRTTAPDLQTTALRIIDSAVSDRADVIISVTRFNSAGEPLYAWPDEMTALATQGQTYPFQLPDDLLELSTARGSMDIPTQLLRLNRPEQPQTPVYVLIAPVTTLQQNTQFLAYELNIDAIFDQTLSLALDDLNDSSSGQLWVLDNVDGEFQRVFTARPEPAYSTIRNDFSDNDLEAINQPTTDEYLEDDDTREAALAPAVAVGHPFLIFVSRNASEAREAVDEDLRLILYGSIGAVLILGAVGIATTQRIIRETTRRQAEFSMRSTARSMLEVSRALNSTLEVDVVLNRILVEFERLIPYYSASVLLLTEQGLEVAAYRGMDTEAHKRVLELDEARAAREVIARGHPVIINDTTNDERWIDLPDSEVRSWMGLPLRVFDRSVGVLNVNSDRLNMFAPEDVSLAETFADQASIALQNARLHELEVRRIDQEMTIARGIQSSLQTETPPETPDLEFAFEAIPARQVSGDFFQIVQLVNDQIGVFVGDVSGKGMPAAMVMAVITTALRDEAARHHNPGDLLNTLNRRLLPRLHQHNMNSALLTALYNPFSQQIIVSNAGMALPYIRGEDGEWSDVEIGGYPLGASENATYGSRSVSFPHGSMIVLYSDGVVEAQNWRGEFFGFERLESLLHKLPKDVNAQQALDAILQAVQEHLGEETTQDDITVVVIRSKAMVPEEVDENDGDDTPADSDEDRSPWPERFMAHWDGVIVKQSEEYTMPRENVEVFLPSTLGYEKVARDAAEAVAREMGFSEDRIDDLKTAVAEACMNAIEHGNLEDRSTSVTVLLSASASHLEVRVEDRGRQSFPDPMPAPGGSDSTRGWGMFFIQNLMDEVEITELPEGGNLVKMTIYLGKDTDSDDAKPDESAE